MTIEKLRQAVSQRPFVPFVIVTGDGTRYRVTHPEMVAIAPKAERTFVVGFGGEEYAIVDLLLVTAIKFGNGQVKRRRAG